MTDRVPANLEPYVDALGEELAIKFFLAFGGASSYFAERPQENSDLVACIGADNVAALARSVRHGHIKRVPLAKEWIANKLYAKGRSVQSIAREMHVSDVSVRKWLKPRDQRQLSLFS